MPFDPYAEWLKIPRDRQPPLDHVLLGLPDGEADAERISIATLDRVALVRRYQTGKHSADAIRVLGELSAAFDRLSRPKTAAASPQQLPSDRQSKTLGAPVLEPSEPAAEALPAKAPQGAARRKEPLSPVILGRQPHVRPVTHSIPRSIEVPRSAVPQGRRKLVMIVAGIGISAAILLGIANSQPVTVQAIVRSSASKPKQDHLSPVTPATLVDPSTAEQGGADDSVEHSQIPVSSVPPSTIELPAPESKQPVTAPNIKAPVDSTPEAVLGDPRDNGPPLVQPNSVPVIPRSPIPSPYKSIAVHSATGAPFNDIGPQNGLLIGFNVVTTTFFNNAEIINAIQPIYLAAGRKRSGAVYGQAKGTPRRIEAKSGYAVGGLVVKSGERIDGFQIIFMRTSGKKLKTDDVYESEWIGGSGGDKKTTLSGDGSSVIGIYGDHGTDVTGLGLIRFGIDPANGE